MSRSRTSAPAAAPRRVGFVSLGCPKALVDSERILTELKRDGYQVVGSYREADLVVVNTCGFIDAARAESLEAIREALAENGRVVVTGCLGRGAGAEEIRRAAPEVLAVTGPAEYEAVVGAVRQYLPPLPGAPPAQLPPAGVKLTPPHYAYLKIGEGCHHRCTFCIIPALRGDLRSRPLGEVLDEAEALVARGVRELLVVSQDTGAYGVDLGHRLEFRRGQALETRLFDLARALGELGVWVRLHYVYPYLHLDRLIPLMAEGRILPYLDIPLQHASPRILRAMRRPAQSARMLERIRRWRAECPELVLRSTFIVGFPGETEEDFRQLLDFLEAAELDRVGCFTYSPVAGAAANALPDPVPEPVKEERRARLMELQSRISARRLAARIGTVQEVLVDEVVEEGAVGRTRGDAPEIDGSVFLDGATHLAPGDLVRVRIEDADEYDLWGVPIDSAAPRR
ncbi:MAG: ribosomal protein S12 methylthiotransferase RimO [Porticoccaceae bacterium]|nr:MAG: ribosomal protein S12 methylthiotransferase RimO [Porticoccaceae bacterium]